MVWPLGWRPLITSPHGVSDEAGRGLEPAGHDEALFDHGEYPGDRLAWWMVLAPGRIAQTKTTRRTKEQR